MIPDCTIADADAAAADDPERPDVYLTAGYGRAAADADGGTWYLAHQSGRILLPYVRRRYDARTEDASSPYGYSGLAIAPGCPPNALARFWAAALGQWRDIGLVTLFLRFSPLDPASVRAAATLPGLTLTRRAETVTVPVSGGPDRIWTGMRGRSRTAIRKAQRAGLRADLRVADLEDLIATAPFRRLYAQTMHRVAAAPGYHFPERYYRLLHDGLGKSLRLAEVRGPDGEVVAAALVLRHRDRAHYHLTGSTPEAARLGANNLLLWTVLRWAAEDGCELVHLGGGVRDRDGLFTFKCSFGGLRTPFFTGAVVLDPPRYRNLLADRARRLGRPIDSLLTTGFFPGYRC
jgi:hypothetical protein